MVNLLVLGVELLGYLYDLRNSTTELSGKRSLLPINYDIEKLSLNYRGFPVKYRTKSIFDV